MPIVPQLEVEAGSQETTELRIEAGGGGRELVVHEDDDRARAFAHRRPLGIFQAHALDHALTGVADIDLYEIWGKLTSRDADVRESPRADARLLMNLRLGRGHAIPGGMTKAAQITDDALEEDPQLTEVRVGERIHGPSRRRPDRREPPCRGTLPHARTSSSSSTAV